MNIKIIVNTRNDYNRLFNSIIGDSKHTMNLDSYKWTATGTMNSGDYMDMYRMLTSVIPADIIIIQADDQRILISYDIDADDNEFLTINGIRQ